jgi:hypothetical protein
MSSRPGIGIIGFGGVHESAGTSVGFRILKGSPIALYTHIIQPKRFRCLRPLLLLKLHPFR